MTTTRVSTKGQVVIPKELRAAHRWDAGQELIVIDTPEGVLLKTKPSANVAEVAGCLSAYRPRRPVTVEDMAAAVAAQAGKSFKE